ncbi:MAG TPA: FecR family protein, partial [Kofleriaceae bacterium]|nr:FecR family protein [Kofleriaceae bacterium]
RVRVQRVSDTFPVLRQAPSPELGWDGVRARIHWTISKAKRDTESHPKVARRAWLPILAAGAAVVAGAAGVYWIKRAPSPAVSVVAPPAHAPEVAAKPAALTALVSRLAGDVMIDGVRSASDGAGFAKPLGAGTVLATGDGRIDVQFGEASAFALGPRSTLELRSFDADTIALVVDGSVDLEVAPRAKHQRFFVIAGDRTIEVRGTRFAVKHDAGGTLVSCQHGLVAVRDAANSAAAAQYLEVGTARKAFVPAQHAVTEAHAVPLTADELVTLVTATPWSTPGWNPDLAARTAPLEIATAAPHRAVRVDGIELGTAPFAMRVAPGRHTVESADAAGRFRRAGWVDVALGAHPSHFEAPAIEEAPLPASPAAAIAARKRQLAIGLDRARLQQCTRRLAKSGLTDTFVQIEITVDAGGAVNVLNIIDTDLPADTASCVHDALAETKFPAGTAATWREKLTL